MKKHTTSSKRQDKERKYYACKHCGSWCVKQLGTCVGDSRDGIRPDYQCGACGGVYGTAAHGYVFITESEWLEETGEQMPRPNTERVLAMQILVALEEEYNFRFRSKELKVLESIVPFIEKHHQGLLAFKHSASERLKAIRKLA